MASKLKTIRLIVVLIVSIWFVGAAIMTVIEHLSKRATQREVDFGNVCFRKQRSRIGGLATTSEKCQ